MLTEIRLQNFKSWQDTGTLRLAPLTGLFGANSSGKTSLIQALLMLKQTVESSDRSRVLHLGTQKAYADLGTFYDLIHQHQLSSELSISLGWKPERPIRVMSSVSTSDRALFVLKMLQWQVTIRGSQKGMQVKNFSYRYGKYFFGMEHKEDTDAKYDVVFEGYKLKRNRGRQWPLPEPIKCYGFPNQVNAYYQNAGFLSELVLAFEENLQRVYYLGPLREYPERSYVWGGEKPDNVGQRGELAVPALLAARDFGENIRTGWGRGARKWTVEERVAEWLKELGLIHSFRLRRIAEHRRDYEVRVRRSPASTEVLITDVGFGVSQILPVLVLCYYAPEGTTLILEQPEIHLHPSVQAGLADVFIDVIQNRKLQIILESHSEHLLRRLQRRVAEEKLPEKKAALYFTSSENGNSILDHLQLDQYGNITNWPENFFGDEMSDLVAMTEAAMARQQGNK